MGKLRQKKILWDLLYCLHLTWDNEIGLEGQEKVVKLHMKQVNTKESIRILPFYCSKSVKEVVYATKDAFWFLKIWQYFVGEALFLLMPSNKSIPSWLNKSSNGKSSGPFSNLFQRATVIIVQTKPQNLFLLWICLAVAPSFHQLFYLFPCFEEPSLIKFLL